MYCVCSRAHDIEVKSYECVVYITTNEKIKFLKSISLEHFTFFSPFSSRNSILCATRFLMLLLLYTQQRRDLYVASLSFYIFWLSVCECVHKFYTRDFLLSYKWLHKTTTIIMMIIIFHQLARKMLIYSIISYSFHLCLKLLQCWAYVFIFTFIDDHRNFKHRKLWNAYVWNLNWNDCDLRIPFFSLCKLHIKLLLWFYVNFLNNSFLSFTDRRDVHRFSSSNNHNNRQPGTQEKENSPPPAL
jgi:hypothetical protein